MKIKLEDNGQDFLELNVDKKGIIKGYSVLFEAGRLSLLGIGTEDGEVYLDLSQLLKGQRPKYKDIYVYIKKTGEKDLLPWEAKTLNYQVVGIE